MSARQYNSDPYEAAVFCADIPLTDAARAVMEAGERVPDYLEKLIAGQNYCDAAHVLARLMPPREGVWWAAQCAAVSLGHAPPAQDASALRAAERWVAEMTEESREKCIEAAHQTRLGSPANCVVMAAFMCGPSLAPMGDPIIAPAPDLPAQMVAGAVMAASRSATPELSAAQLANYLEQGKLLYNQVVGGTA